MMQYAVTQVTVTPWTSTWIFEKNTFLWWWLGCGELFIYLQFFYEPSTYLFLANLWLKSELDLYHVHVMHNDTSC